MMTPHEREVMQNAWVALCNLSERKDVLKTVDETEALRACLAQPDKANQCGETCERAKLCAVCAAGISQPEQYDQTELELCKKCGWKAVWPDGCLVCEKQKVKPEKEFNPASEKMVCVKEDHKLPKNIPIVNLLHDEIMYAAPHKKEWVGLTDDEAIEIEDRSPDIRWAIIQAEDKLREKNA